MKIKELLIKLNGLTTKELDQLHEFESKTTDFDFSIEEEARNDWPTEAQNLKNGEYILTKANQPIQGMQPCLLWIPKNEQETIVYFDPFNEEICNELLKWHQTQIEKTHEV